MTRSARTAETVVRALHVVLALGWTAVLVGGSSLTDPVGAATAAGTAVLVACLADREHPWLIALVGGVVSAAAVHEMARPDDPRPLLGIVAGAMLVAVPAVVRLPVARLLVPAGLLVAVRLAGDVDPLVAVGLAGGAALLAVVRRPPGPVLALAALSALALDARAASLLLAAAAVLAASTDDRWVLVGAVPGAAALTVALAPAEEAEVAAVAVLLVVAALVACARPSTEPVQWPVALPLAALVLAPTAWTWVGDPRLDGYATGVAVAIAGAALTAVAAAASHLRRYPS